MTPETPEVLRDRAIYAAWAFYEAQCRPAWDARRQAIDAAHAVCEAETEPFRKAREAAEATAYEAYRKEGQS